MQKQHKNHNVAPLAGSNFVSPDTPSVPGVKILIPPELNARPDRPYVVNADNKAAPPMMLVVTLVADLVIGVLTFLAFHYLGQLDGLLSFLLAIVGVVVIALIALFLLSGDMPAFFEIQRSERNEKRRIEAVERIGLGWVDVAKIKAHAERDDAQARLIAAQNEQDALRHAMLVDHERQEVANQLETYKPPNTYTPADPMPDPSYTAVMEFVANRLFQNANPTTGRIAVAVPWGTTGGLSPKEAGRVLEWVKVVNTKATKGALFFYKDRGWHVNIRNYRTAKQVMDELEREPLLRG